MSTKTVELRIRIPAARARQAQSIFREMGTDAEDAVNLFFARVVAQRGLPFPLMVEEDDDADLYGNEELLNAVALHRAGNLKAEKPWREAVE
jgi:addiction module RelB/DinJ family antitoxin